MTIRKRTVIKKRRVVRRSVSAHRSASPRKLVIKKIVHGRKPGEQWESPITPGLNQHKNNQGDTGRRRTDI